MLKSSLFIIGVIFVRLTSFSQMPGPIEVIASKFYNTYDISHQNIFIDFEKRRWQWKVRAGKYNGSVPVTIGSYLFFDVDSGGFQQLPFKLKTDSKWVHINQYLDSYQLSNFHLHQYFGYDGWYKDVIADLSDKDHLSDSGLYSLARAYSNYASCLLSDRTGDAIKSEIFNMPIARNCMTPEQRTKYKDIQSKAIHCFSRLCQQNRDFETVVGKIPIKYANEVMVEFLTYLTFSDGFAAVYPLPDHLYPDSVVDKVQRVLKKCPRNAIFLSYGDNDFYPILYVQHKLGVRRDIHLINQNLITIDRLAYMATQPQFDSRPIRLSVNYQQYKEGTNDYLSLQDGLVAMKFADVIDTIQRGHGNKYGIFSLPSKEFIIKRTSGKTNAINDDTLHFRTPAAYLFKNEWLLLDIMNNLDGRKLCSLYPLYDTLSPLNTYFTKIDEDLFVF